MADQRAAENLLFRPVRAAELAALAALEREAFADPWSEKSLREEYAAAQAEGPQSWPRLFAGCRPDGELLVYSLSRLLFDELELYRIAVRRDFRGRGLAAAHLRALGERGRRCGARKLTLEVREGNRPARRLYEKLGFGQVGRRPAYYSDTGEAALLLDLALRDENAADGRTSGPA